MEIWLLTTKCRSFAGLVLDMFKCDTERKIAVVILEVYNFLSANVLRQGVRKLTIRQSFLTILYRLYYRGARHIRRDEEGAVLFGRI